MKIVLKRIIAPVSICLLLMLSCEIADETIVSTEDSTAAALLASDAKESFLLLIGNMLVADPDSAQEIINSIDFTSVNALYAESHFLDYRNLEVNFGLAYSSALILSQNLNLNNLLDSDFRVFQPLSASDNPSPTVGYGFGLPLSTHRLKRMISQYFEIPVALSRLTFEKLPEFNELQNRAMSDLIPMIDAGLTALDSLEIHSDFVFDLSETIQVDVIDIVALQASFYALRGLFNSISAYNFELSAMDSAGIMDGFSLGSDFGTLKDNGAEILTAAMESAGFSISRTRAMLNMISSETPESSHFLSNFSSGSTAQALTELDALSNLLGVSNSYSYGHESDAGNLIVDGTMQIDISQYYSNPVPDLKTLLPTYTIGITTAYNYNNVTLSEDINVEEAEVVVANLNNTPVSINFSYSETGADTVARVTIGPFTYNLMTANQAELPVAFWDLWAEFLGLVGQYSGELYNFPEISLQWAGTVSTGQSLVIDGSVVIDYQERLGSYIAPQLTWNASSYADWLTGFQNPTVNMLFPNFTGVDLANLLDYSWE